MSSIVLEPGVKDMILDDCRDFLRSEDWFVKPYLPYCLTLILFFAQVCRKRSVEESHIVRRSDVGSGIPFRRGYLLHGVPGRWGYSLAVLIGPNPEILDSGKTSLIHSLAGELGLDIYVVSLSSKGYAFTRLVCPA